jgi:hypothetical protein
VHRLNVKVTYKTPPETGLGLCTIGTAHRSLPRPAHPLMPCPIHPPSPDRSVARSVPRPGSLPPLHRPNSIPLIPFPDLSSGGCGCEGRVGSGAGGGLPTCQALPGRGAATAGAGPARREPRVPPSALPRGRGIPTPAPAAATSRWGLRSLKSVVVRSVGLLAMYWQFRR